MEDFGEPVYVDALPAQLGKGGRKSTTPAVQTWLGRIEPGKTAQLPSKDEDGAHTVSRVTQIRKVAGSAFKIETRSVVPGKRYMIFATVNGKTNKFANGATPDATIPAAPATT